MLYFFFMGEKGKSLKVYRFSIGLKHKTEQSLVVCGWTRHQDNRLCSPGQVGGSGPATCAGDVLGRCAAR